MYAATCLFRPVAPQHDAHLRPVLRLIAKAVVFIMADGSEMTFTWSDDIEMLAKTHRPAHVHIHLHDDLQLKDGQTHIRFIDQLDLRAERIYVRGHPSILIGDVAYHTAYGIIVAQVGEDEHERTLVDVGTLTAYQALANKWIAEGRLQDVVEYDHDKFKEPRAVVVRGADLVMSENVC